MKISRTWAMVNKETFRCKPIGAFMKKYITPSGRDVDPFARNCDWAPYTNDLDPNTLAQYHMDARDFLDLLFHDGIVADLIILDPPYSQVQVSYVYKSIGREYKPFGDDNNAKLYRQVRDKADRILKPGGVVLSFGWNSVGMGEKRGYELLEVLLVCHGGAHNDTICIAERKNKYQCGAMK